MIKLDRPAQQAGEVFTVCISRIQNTNLKNRLTDVTAQVVQASTDFEIAAADTLLHQLLPQNMVGQVTKKEMEKVYTLRMAKKGSAGRHFYDSLLNSAPQGKCPLCGHRTVTTLDHHLPKTSYPALVVAPLNLVPACSDCNKSKLVAIPNDSSEETLHPYFDDIDNSQWLNAEVIEMNPASLRFFVSAPDDWSDTLKARVENHFNMFGLAKLYSSQAADELLNIRRQFMDIYANGGATLVKLELNERAASCRVARNNGWRTITYQAFARNDWFCGGGFLNN